MRNLLPKFDYGAGFGDFKEMAPDEVARFVCDQIADGLKSGKESTI